MLFQRSDFKILFVLAVPLILSGMVESSTGFISGVFLAKISPLAFAAGSLASWFFSTVLVIIWGILSSVSVLISRHYGAKKIIHIGRIVRDAIALACLLTIPCSLLIWNMSPLLSFLGQKPAVIILALPYLHAIVWGLLPNFISLILLQFFIGLGKTKVNLFFTLFLVPLNITLNYILIFGKFGIPALGIAGLGWATTLTYWIYMFALIIFILSQKRYKTYLSTLLEMSMPKYLWELILVGVPMGLMFFIEVGFFFLMTLIMGHISINALAANQLTMQYLGFFVTLVFATAQAVTVRMGHEIGAKNIASANRAAYAGLAISFGFIFIAALLEWFMPNLLIRLDFNPTQLHNSSMLELTINFLAIAALFQLCESLRITLFGALRALKDTKFTLFSSFIAFWIIAIPLGYFFAQTFNMGPYGYWWALTVSGITNFLLLLWRFNYKMKQCLE